MPRTSVIRPFFPFLTLLSLGSAWGQDKITYADHVQPLLQSKCFSCHNPDKQKGGLDLTSFSTAMKGGSGGAVAVSGDPDRSRIFTVTAHKEEPFMPPEGGPLAANELEIISQWVKGGLLETKNSVARKAEKPLVDLKVANPNKKPDGPPPMPEHLLQEPVVLTTRGTTVNALAASPWAPLVAVGGQKQVLLYDTDQALLSGVLPFPEGFVNSLKFSRNGSLLIAGGGRGGKSGKAVVWNVRTGQRLAEVGNEFDSVMSADISPDQTRVTIGTTGKKVKAYNTTNNEVLYTIGRHSEWVLSVESSPDGVLLASGDRNGGLYVWEAATGAEFYVLGGHTAAITEVSWRLDSNLLCSASEDGTVRLWEMGEGKEAKKWTPHGGAGVLAARFTSDGNIITAGRDKRMKLWDAAGKELADFKDFPDLINQTAGLSDGKKVIAGDWNGKVSLWSVAPVAKTLELTSAPPDLSARLVEADAKSRELLTLAEQAKQADIAAQAELDKASQEKAQLEADINAKKASLTQLAADLKILQEQKSPGAKKAVEEARKATPPDQKVIDAALAAEKEIEAGIAKITEEEKKLPPLLKSQEDYLVTLPKKAEEIGKKKAETAAKAKAAADELALAQRRITLLKAAQFNVAVLREKDALAQLESEHNAFTTQLKEAEKGLSEYKNQIASLKQKMAETGPLVPQKEAALPPLQEKQKTMEATLASHNQALADATAKLEAGKKASEEQQHRRDRYALINRQSAGETVSTFAIAVISRSIGQTAMATQDAALKFTRDQQPALEQAVKAATDQSNEARKNVDAAAAALAQSQKELEAVKNELITAQKGIEAAEKNTKEAETVLATIPPQKAEKEKLLASQKSKVERLHQEYLGLLPK